MASDAEKYGTLLGTGVGAAFGGPVGAGIGGALGGAVGGLFGGSSKRKARPVLTDLTQISQSGENRLALGMLADLLRSGGQLDPRLANRAQTTVRRGAEAQQQAVLGEASRRNLGGFAGSTALQAAIGLSGDSKAADIDAQEAQLQRQRQMQILDLFNRVFTQPGLQASAILSGTSQFNAQQQTQSDAALLALLGTLAQAGATYAGSR